MSGWGQVCADGLSPVGSLGGCKAGKITSEWSDRQRGLNGGKTAGREGPTRATGLVD